MTTRACLNQQEGSATSLLKLKDDMGCQAGVEPSNLTTVIITDKKTTTKVHAAIKLGIDAHAKWYYVARLVDIANAVIIKTFLG